MAEGADGQPPTVPPPRPPSISNRPRIDGSQGKERREVRAPGPSGSGACRATIGEGLLDQMELRDFVIGETFWTHTGAFRCTDIGTRVVVAVQLGPRVIGRAERLDGELQITKRIDDDPSWLNGPPYAVEEVVFDENELLGCFRTEAELLADGDDD